MPSLAHRLEHYTIKRPHEVLLVTTETDGELDYVLIFKGFSSSLVHPTAVDPDVPVIADTAQIVSIDRLQAPYHPDSPQYIDQGLSLEAMQQYLHAVGV